jgi:hypothetical protein
MPTKGPPPSLVQDKGLITIHADLAWFDGDLPEGAVCLSGTVLSGRDSLRASTDGIGPIVWQLPPGDYTIQAYGYPIDRMDPLRDQLTFSFTVTAPDRIAQLQRLLLEFSQRLYQYEMVKDEIMVLNPTREELRQVLDPEGS